MIWICDNNSSFSWFLTSCQINHRIIFQKFTTDCTRANNENFAFPNFIKKIVSCYTSKTFKSIILLLVINFSNNLFPFIKFFWQIFNYFSKVS